MSLCVLCCRKPPIFLVDLRARVGSMAGCEAINGPQAENIRRLAGKQAHILTVRGHGRSNRA
jgi:hypothetical protein